MGHGSNSLSVRYSFTTLLQFLGYKRGDFPAAEHNATHCLSLPIYPEIRDEQIECVVETLSKNYVADVTEIDNKEDNGIGYPDGISVIVPAYNEEHDHQLHS